VYMRDPHVVELRYRVQYSNGVAFDEYSLPIERKCDSFRLCVTDEAATAQMKAHYAMENEAREVVEAFLRARVGDLRSRETRGNRPEVRLRGSRGYRPKSATYLRRGEFSAHTPGGSTDCSRAAFPDPKEFAVSPDVEVMWRSYESYLREHNRLLHMAYTCLTRLTSSVGGDKREAANKYRISRNVLTKLATLSTSGDEATARRWVPGRSPQALTEQEIDWVENAVRMLILRAGQHAADPSREWPRITMAHLPEL
jgi:hypothetical protein